MTNTINQRSLVNGADKNIDRANVIILYNYYKSWKADEYQDALRLLEVMVDGLKALGHTVKVVEFWKDVRPALEGFDPNEWVIFQWCEGVEDEVGGDARICADLDEMGFAYTGNSPTTLRLSVEKGKVKKVLDRWKIPTPAGREFASPDEITTWQHWPSIVKPVSQHCSAGVNRDAVVHNLKELKARVAYVNNEFKEAALVEKFVDGREINVGVWGNGRPRVLPLREIDFSRIANPLHRMVTWDSKWVPDSQDWNTQPVITDVDVHPEIRARIEEIVLKTYRVFDCRDYARVDLRLDSDGQPYVIDVNPNPDITYEGGFAGGCAAAGYNYGEAISNIISMAVARRNRRNALANSLRKIRAAVPTPVPVEVEVVPA